MFWFHNKTTVKKKPQVTHNNVAVEPCGTSDLWDYVLDMDWDRVRIHAKEHPCDAEWQDGHWHESPLYLSCQQNPPVDAVQAIIEAYPAAVLIPSRANHDLPLHIACRYQVNEDILESLLQHFPCTSVEQTRWGRTPVMALWEFRPKDTALDEAYWNKIMVVLSAVARFREAPHYYASRIVYASQSPGPRTNYFRNMCPDKCTGTSCDPKKLWIVHAAVSLGALSCPEEVLRYVLERFHDQVFLTDRSGQLPLHIAVGPTTWSHTTRRKYKPREQRFVSMLLEAYPGAAKQRLRGGDHHDRFPLHVALANRHTWGGGIEELLHAAPRVLSTTDPLTNLYPFQLAAIPVGDTTVDLDTIYKLLRSKPDIMGYFDFQKQAKVTELITEPSKREETEQRCSLYTQETLLGAVTAILIGSIGGVVFGK